MSAPDTNAWSPAPVTTTTRMAGSFSNSSMMTGIASHMSEEVALRLAGLLKMSLPTGPCFSAIMLGVGLSMLNSLFQFPCLPRLTGEVARRAGGGKPQSRYLQVSDLKFSEIGCVAFPLPTLPRLTGEENERRSHSAI